MTRTSTGRAGHRDALGAEPPARQLHGVMAAAVLASGSRRLGPRVARKLRPPAHVLAKPSAMEIAFRIAMDLLIVS
jgi:hypothetical protein